MLIKAEDWRPQGVESLEHAAMQALRVEGNVCVTAGAGAGKTEFLAQKAAYLLQTGLCSAPKRILAISFKVDAAKTLGDRVKKRCAADQARRFVSMTFDAFSKSLVDQFRMAIPEFYQPPEEYEISFPPDTEIQEFLDKYNLQSVKGFKGCLAERSLPYDGMEASSKRILDAYWQEQYAINKLTFPMINRLAEYLLRSNKYIRRALRQTYQFVFLDEFQDITEAQFQLLNSAFKGSDAVLTAVGDDKQKIMGWAGAMPEAFQTFRHEYSAQPFALLNNYRSHPDLVAVQNIIAQAFYPDAAPAIAKATRTVSGDVAAIWEFPDGETEATTLARWIAGEIRNGVKANEIAILVRQKANDAERALKEAFETEGVALRNLARNIGGMAIGDILSEDLTDILLPFLHLGAEKPAPEAFEQATANMLGLAGISEDDEKALRRVSDNRDKVITEMRKLLHDNTPNTISAQQLIDILIAEIGEEAIRQSVPNYQQDKEFSRAKAGFEALLDESMQGAANWPQVLGRFGGRGQVPLLTIHKSKGMEFHTMIFYGFDQDTWWSLTDEVRRAEERNAFYVAFTRAKQRAFFTRCGRHIAWLERILGSRVSHIKGETLIA